MIVVKQLLIFFEILTHTQKEEVWPFFKVNMNQVSISSIFNIQVYNIYILEIHNSCSIVKGIIFHMMYKNPIKCSKLFL